SMVADIYAFGCLCWHLLTGRSPRGGGDHVAKMAAVISGKIPDIRRIAPTAPAELLAVLQRCLDIDPLGRPQAFAEISELLGPPTPAGRRLLVDLLAHSRRSTVRPDWRWQVRTTMRRSATHVIATAAC